MFLIPFWFVTYVPTKVELKGGVLLSQDNLKPDFLKLPILKKTHCFWILSCLILLPSCRPYSILTSYIWALAAEDTPLSLRYDFPWPVFFLYRKWFSFCASICYQHNRLITFLIFYPRFMMFARFHLAFIRNRPSFLWSSGQNYLDGHQCFIHHLAFNSLDLINSWTRGLCLNSFGF